MPASGCQFSFVWKDRKAGANYGWKTQGNKKIPKKIVASNLPSLPKVTNKELTNDDLPPNLTGNKDYGKNVFKSQSTSIAGKQLYLNSN